MRSNCLQNLYSGIMKFSSQSTLLLVLNLELFTKKVVVFFFFFFFGGGSRKSYVILMGGHAKCLRLLTGGEGGGSKIHKTCLRNTWMFPWEN